MRAILTYHSIENTALPIATSPSVFRDQMAALGESGARVVALDELLVLDAGSGPAVALTFDDGFANFADSAAPVLTELGFPASIFVVSGFVGKTNDWPGQARGYGGRGLMSWDELAAMRTAGFELGAHTRSHPPLSTLDEAAAVGEIRGGTEDMEQRLGCAVHHFAYPYGDAPPAAAKQVRALGWTGLTTGLGYLRPGGDPALLPRLDAYYFRDPRRVERLFAPATRRWIAWRRALRAVRRHTPL